MATVDTSMPACACIGASQPLSGHGGKSASDPRTLAHNQQRSSKASALTLSQRSSQALTARSQRSSQALTALSATLSQRSSQASAPTLTDDRVQPSIPYPTPCRVQHRTPCPSATQYPVPWCRVPEVHMYCALGRCSPARVNRAFAFVDHALGLLASVHHALGRWLAIVHHAPHQFHTHTPSRSCGLTIANHDGCDRSLTSLHDPPVLAHLLHP